MRRNFIYPKDIDKHIKYGANFLSNRVIKEDGDWRKVLTPQEEQRQNGVEPSTCFIFAQIHTDTDLEEFLYGEQDNNWSERFTAQFAGGTPYGGDPLKAADAIYDHGLVKETSMPFKDITSWQEYHSWKGVIKDKVIAEGLKDKSIKDRRSGVLFTRDYPLKTKYDLIEQGLKRSPLPLSVWGVEEGDTYAPKPDGVFDTHMVKAKYLDRSKGQYGQIWIEDTYKPFIKALPVDYNPDFAMGRTVLLRNDNEFQDLVENSWDRIIHTLNRLWNFFKVIIDKVKWHITPENLISRPQGKK